MNYFTQAKPNIILNENLREPQLQAYKKCVKYFQDASVRKEAIINLPTGTGKTGLIAIAPFGISKKRVLVITPQTVVQDTVMGSLDSRSHKNFWLLTKVFENENKQPVVVEYNKNVTRGVLNLADIVILNIHKLQDRLESSLLHLVENDFFDLIIIDEAHHSEAHTWKNTIETFEDAHVIKVTGTPFRSDGVKITGDTIYTYPLSRAMVNGYVKSLERFKYIPDKMEFTIDGKDQMYSLEEIKALNLRNDEWISRQVALSEASNMSVVKRTIDLLNEMRTNTKNPHKIVAVACSIDHAKQLKVLYEKENLNVALVHSKMEKSDLYKEFKRIDQHEVEVVINVALLGEGYDHKFLSIAAIFRPFRSDLPYQQFIGRILRSIGPDDTANLTTEDNIAKVVHHQELGLDQLWESYKKEIIKSGIIKNIRKEKRINKEYETQDLLDSEIQESDTHNIESDTFIDTKLLSQRKKEQEADNEKIKALMEALGDLDESTAREMLELTRTPDERILRPDLLQADLRSELNIKITEEIIPDVLEEFGLELTGDELYNNRGSIFPLQTQRIINKKNDNGACLGIHLNDSLRRHIGASRSKWEISDYDNASNELDHIVSFIMDKLNRLFKEG